MSESRKGQSKPIGSASVYARFQTYLESVCGIMLGDNKQFLVESRLNRILQSRKIANLSELVDILESSPNVNNLKQIVVDAMTTNETQWMRDAHPYDWLRTQLFREIVKQKQSGRREIKIWSAACSSGQEPYSISIQVHEARRAGILPPGFEVKIVATDISKGILEIAQSGTYDSRLVARGLPNEYLHRYFKPIGAGCYVVNPEVKSRIEFKSLNLKENFRMLGRFDIVFCRNVLIYFSAELKSDIIRRIHGSLVPGGYLLLGGSEALNDMTDLYEMVKYRPGIAFKSI